MMYAFTMQSLNYVKRKLFQFQIIQSRYPLSVSGVDRWTDRDKQFLFQHR